LSTHSKGEEVQRRLSKIGGHVRGIIKMVQEGQDCPAILLQIAAVQSALGKVSQIILEDHVESCVAKAIREGRGEEAVQDLKEAFARLL